MRFARFLIVGVGNTALTFALFNLFLFVLGWPAWLANSVAYTAGIANSFVWNRRWTFSDRIDGSSRRVLVKFIAANLGGLLITTGVVALLEAPVAGPLQQMGLSSGLAYNVVEAAAVCCGLVWNYLVFTLWVFPARSDVRS